MNKIRKFNRTGLKKVVKMSHVKSSTKILKLNNSEKCEIKSALKRHFKQRDIIVTKLSVLMLLTLK